MFASNQRFDMKCGREQLQAAIEFLVKLSDVNDRFTRPTDPAKPIFCNTGHGIYLFGYYYPNRPVPEGWSEYPFDYDSKIIAQIVWQWLQNQKYPIAPRIDGSVAMGARVCHINDLLQELRSRENIWVSELKEMYGIPEDCGRTIAVFQPTWLEYHK